MDREIIIFTPTGPYAEDKKAHKQSGDKGDDAVSKEFPRQQLGSAAVEAPKTNTLERKGRTGTTGRLEGLYRLLKKRASVLARHDMQSFGFLCWDVGPHSVFHWLSNQLFRQASFVLQPSTDGRVNK